jgi:4-amino-4-deoxy-L-arabinose transferase-like glycosyltransferase
MHYVSLIVEFLRGRPSVVFWTAALTQAALWTLVPSLFYSAPPGDLATVLAIGHEFVLGSYMGPPLAFWLGEVAFRIAGMFGVYLLAQACVVVAFWAVFTLGRAIVGTRHAVLAVLLMIGVASFNVPTPNFGPAILALPLWALALLHYWRALGEGARGYWFLLALDLGLLLLASYAGVILLALIIVFSPLTARGRHAFTHVEPWIAVILMLIVVFPHAAWLKSSADLVWSAFDEGARVSKLPPAAWIGLTLVLTHLGAFLLIVLASGWRGNRRERAPEIDRPPAEAAARYFVFFFALAPAVVTVAFVAASGHLGPFARIGPLVLMTSLAVIVAAGNQVRLFRERLVSSAWVGLLTLPPLLVTLMLIVLPWTAGVDLKTGQPANAMGRFFADSFQRRTGDPLPYVAGDPQLAALVALAAPGRPSVYFNGAPERSPWADAQKLRAQGAILLWPATDTAGAPPAALKSQFPEIVPELPRAFARTVQGVLPLLRIGWAVLRPAAEAPPQR